jgi:5-methylcytosine-specific restriction enzyme subunit McrC
MKSSSANQIHNFTLHEWQTMNPSTHEELSDLIIDDSNHREIANELTQSRVLEILELRSGLQISSYSYVGKIRLGNITLTVKPKIAQPQLIQLIRYAYGLRDIKRSTDTKYETTANAFQDLLIQQLVLEVAELLSRGLHRNYRRTSDELSSPRGRIDVLNIVKQHWQTTGKLPCTYFPRSVNCIQNQALLSGLILASKLTESIILRSECKKLIALLSDGIDSVILRREFFIRLNRESDRLTHAYRSAIQIIKLLYDSQGVILDTGVTTPRLQGFLFDMNRFFQKLIFRF